MEFTYKDQRVNEFKEEFEDKSIAKKVVHLSYEEELENLLSSDDPEIILPSIENMGTLCNIDFTQFLDCVVFTKIAEIANHPFFEDYLVVLRFFYVITWNCSDEKELAVFISPSFLSLLKTFLYINHDNPTFYGYLFHIYGNIFTKSQFFSEQIFSIAFLRRLFDIVKNLPFISGDFLDLLGCILVRFTILMNYDPNPLPTITEIFSHFLESSDFQNFSDAFSILARISSLPFHDFLKSFFTPYIVEKAIENILVNVNEIVDEEGTAQIGPYKAHKTFINSLKKNSLILLLNFTAIGEDTQSILIENTTLLDMDIFSICSSYSDQDDFNEFTVFFPDIASNLFRSSHSIAIQFAYSTYWQSLLRSYELFNSATKNKLAMSISISISSHKSDEDIITTILAEDQSFHIFDILYDCFALDSVDFQLTCIEAIQNMIEIYQNYPTLFEINNVFCIMNDMGFIDLIQEYSQESENLPQRSYSLIQSILSFFKEEEIVPQDN